MTQDSNQSRRPSRYDPGGVFRVVCATSIVMLVFVATAFTQADVDLWGHVRFGMDILASGHISTVDPYSFTSDRPWVNHEWLAEIIFAMGWTAIGSLGLILIKVACIAGTLMLLWYILLSEISRFHPKVVILGLTLVGILPRLHQVRPQLFSVLLFALLMFIVSRADRARHFALFWSAPVLAVWANLHGGWIVGVATLGIWCVGLGWQHRECGWRSWLVLGYAAAGTVATLLNPYGIGLWTFLFQTVGFGREAILEWGPVWQNPASLLAWLLFAGLAIGTIVRGPWPANPARVLLPLAWGAASFQVNRLDAFFALSVATLLGPRLQWLIGAEDRGRSAAALPKLARNVTIAVTAALILSIPFVRRTMTSIRLYGPWWPEPEVVEFIEAHQLSGRFVTFFRWGEYAIWHLAPSVKVSMDGRRETVYSDRVIAEHLQLYAGTPEGLAYVSSLPCDYIWLPASLPIGALRQSGWIPVFEGPQSVLLASQRLGDRFGGQVLRVSRPTHDRPFPGP